MSDGPAHATTPARTAPPHRGRFRTVREMQVLALLAAAGLTALYWYRACASPAAQRDWREQIAAGVPAGETILPFNSTGAGGLILLVAWVFTANWLADVRANALLLEPGGQRRSWIWSYLGWVVPVVSLWFPYQIVQDSRRATQRAAGRPPGDPLWPWWACWLATAGLGQWLDQRYVADAEPLPAWQLTLAILATVTLLLWTRLVLQIGAAQRGLVARQLAGDPLIGE